MNWYVEASARNFLGEMAIWPTSAETNYSKRRNTGCGFSIGWLAGKIPQQA
jgi:hypothetical protein